MLRLQSQGLRAVRTCGAIPPMPVAWAPPVYGATGGYAAPSPCLSSALTIACTFVLRLFSHLSCAFKFCIYVLQFVLHFCIAFIFAFKLCI